jgi:hypothetical protein
MGDQLREWVVQEVNTNGGRTMGEERFIHGIGSKTGSSSPMAEVAIAQRGPEASRASHAEKE